MSNPALDRKEALDRIQLRVQELEAVDDTKLAPGDAVRRRG